MMKVFIFMRYTRMGELEGLLMDKKQIDREIQKLKDKSKEQNDRKACMPTINFEYLTINLAQLSLRCHIGYAWKYTQAYLVGCNIKHVWCLQVNRTQKERDKEFESEYTGMLCKKENKDLPRLRDRREQVQSNNQRCCCLQKHII